MPSPRPLALGLAASALALAAIGLGLTLADVPFSDGLEWQHSGNLRAAAAPLVLAVLFGGAVLAAWTRRGTSFVLLCVAPALTQLFFYVRSFGFPLGHGGTVEGLYRHPLNTDLAGSGAEVTAMAAIAAGVVAAPFGLGLKSARKVPPLLVVALPVLVGSAALAHVGAHALSALLAKEGWWDVWHYAGFGLVMFVVGAGVLLLSRVGRGFALPLRVFGGLLLLAPLAREMWDFRPMVVRRMLGEHVQAGNGFGIGLMPDGWHEVAELLDAVGAGVLQVTFVLAALVGVAVMLPRRREDEA